MGNYLCTGVRVREWLYDWKIERDKLREKHLLNFSRFVNYLSVLSVPSVVLGGLLNDVSLARENYLERGF